MTHRSKSNSKEGMTHATLRAIEIAGAGGP